MKRYLKGRFEMRGRFIKFPVSEMTKEPEQDGYYKLYVDYYWVVRDECFLRFENYSFQCNKSYANLRLLYEPEEIKQFKKVWVRK